MIKSPFDISQKAVSVKLCEELVRAAMPHSGEVFIEPVRNDEISDLVNNHLVHRIKERYNSNVIKSDVTIESYSTNSTPNFTCESTVFSNGMWYRNKDIDFVTIVFLKDHLVTGEAMDPAFEVVGGKLEFPTFKFSFNPERGTCVTYPAVPNFMNAISKVKIGQAELLRILHRSDTMFAYDPNEYPGNLKSWFAHLS